MATPNVFADQIEVGSLRQPFSAATSEASSVPILTIDRGCGVAAPNWRVMAGADRVKERWDGIRRTHRYMDLVTLAMNLYSQGIEPTLDLSRMG